MIQIPFYLILMEVTWHYEQKETFIKTFSGIIDLREVHSSIISTGTGQVSLHLLDEVQLEL